MKRFFFLFLLVVSLLLSTVAVNVAAQQDNVGIGPNEAIKIAKDYVANAPHVREKWKGASFKVLTELYDHDDTLLGYYIQVFKGKQEAGHLVVAAREDLPPVLQGGESSYASRLIPELKKGNKIYYLGASQFNYAKNRDALYAKMENKKKLVLNELKKAGKMNTQEYKFIENKKITPVKKDKNLYKKAWDRIHKNVLNSGGNSSVQPSEEVTAQAAYSKVLDVPLIGQNLSSDPSNACGPTTGAMIMNYYKSRGYNVYGTVNYGNSHQKFIDHLKIDMETAWYGTLLDNFRNGMLTHFSHTDSNWTVTAYSTAVGYYGLYQDHIIGNAPVAIMFDFWDDGGSGVNWHWVAGKGYYNYNYSQAIVNNPATVAEEWYGWTANDQDWSLVFSGYNW